jgi:DNA-binding protein YbaB
MFDFFKNFKELTKLVSSESVVIEKNGIKVKINGKFEVEELVLNPALEIEKQQKILKECINEGLMKLQTNLFSKLLQSKFKI